MSAHDPAPYRFIPVNPFHLLTACAALAWAGPAGAQAVMAQVDPPVIEHIEDTTTVEFIQPTNTMQGTRGLPQTSSAPPWISPPRLPPNRPFPPEPGFSEPCAIADREP
jgi:hypothetical protein